MDITKEKSEIYGVIAALRVSSEGYPKKFTTNSIESISKKTNSLDFLMDLSKSLIGFEVLKDSLIDLLTYNLDSIELDVKQAIKSSLKDLVSCSVNPSLPQSFIDDGLTLELSNIDLLTMFKVNPISESGKLLYNDINLKSNSTDFNTYLYNVIQDNGGESFWGQSTINKDIIGIKFNQTGANVDVPNNTITIKPSTLYSTKKLTDLNNDYIDSIKLFDTGKLINNTVDSIFGTISSNINKSKETINVELKINQIIDKIINNDFEEEIDDSYFEFSNQELGDIEYKSELKRRGKNVIKTFDNIETSIPLSELSSLNQSLDNLLSDSSLTISSLVEVKSTIVRSGLDRLGDVSVIDIDSENKLNVKTNFIEQMLRNLMNSIVGVIVSPKLITILAINHSIIYGEPFTGIDDFMKKNRGLIFNILQTVRDSIVSVILDRVLKEVKTLVTENLLKTQIEKLKSKKKQLLSLVSTKFDKLNFQ